MNLVRFISNSRIIDIKGTCFSHALEELLEVIKPLLIKDKNAYSKDTLLELLLNREKNMTTYLGHGVALPHLRIPLSRPYVFAIGRCLGGVDYEGLEEYQEIRLICLLLASDKEKNYLKVLSSLARIFQDEDVVGHIVNAPSLKAFKSEVKRVFGGVVTLPKMRGNKFNRLILAEARKIAKGASCTHMMVFADTFTDGVSLDPLLDGFKTVLVTQSTNETTTGSSSSIDAIISVRSFSKNRLSQMRSAVLIGLSRGAISYDAKVCCVGGIPNSNQFDTVVVVDVSKEFQSIFNNQSDILPKGVKPEVIECVLAIATELSVEGREGRPVGACFVIGDVSKLKPFTKPLVLNPFFGYKDEDRNILNPFMDETVKEFSTIDGAFIIRGDGVLDSAGSLIYVPEYSHELPGGLGSRHAAAAAISKSADCISITVSSSTRQVTLFRRGRMLPLI